MARYRIAVCDDEPSELEDIVQSVKRYDVHGDFDIENYTDGAVLLSDLQLKKNFFDLLLLDIEMPSNADLKRRFWLNYAKENRIRRAKAVKGIR